MGIDNVGACCSGRMDSHTKQCIGTCKTRFRVCLKHYQAKIDTTSPCTFGDVVTPVLGENTINLTTQSHQMGFINPIRFPFDFTWPVSKFFLINGLFHCETVSTFIQRSYPYKRNNTGTEKPTGL